VFFDDLIITHTKGKVLQEDHYYPYGLSISALSSTAPLSKPNNFKLSGNEEQAEFDFNVYDFNARTYDPALGRFMNIDPMAGERVWINPYNYVQNNPLVRTDALGMLDNYYLFEDGSMQVVETDDQSNTYFYVDNETGQHELGTFDKNENGLIGLDEFSYSSDGVQAGFEVSEGNLSESFMSGDALGALLGALADSGVTDLVINRVSNSDGTTPGDSKTHKNGNNFDSRFLRNDGSNDPLDLRTGFDKVDLNRTNSFNSSLKKFGFTNPRATKNIEIQNAGIIELEMPIIKQVPGTTHLSNHNDHQHNERFRPRITRHKR
jgi:RHS repeat-associated protein